MPWGIRDAKFLSNHFPHASPRPYLTPEPVRFRSLAQVLRELLQIRRSQSRLASTLFSAAQQRLKSLVACPLEPLADGTFGHAQRFRNACLVPAFFVQLPGPEPARFPPITESGWYLASFLFCIHSSSLPDWPDLSSYVWISRCAAAGRCAGATNRLWSRAR